MLATTAQKRFESRNSTSFFVRRETQLCRRSGWRRSQTGPLLRAIGICVPRRAAELAFQPVEPYPEIGCDHQRTARQFVKTASYLTAEPQNWFMFRRRLIGNNGFVRPVISCRFC